MLRSIFILVPILYSAVLHAQSTTPQSPDGKWTKILLTSEFWAEGACAADVNKDGSMDVLCGPFWYAGPDFKTRHEILPAPQAFQMKKPDGSETTMRGFKGVVSGDNGFSENFLSYSADINGDTWPDYIVIGHPGTETWWYENPKGEAKQWTRHLALEKTDNESPKMVDITGDGIPELLCMSNGTLGYASPNPKNPTEKWAWHVAAKNPVWAWNTHGLGYGDVNGDGKIDLLTAVNWWEQPASLKDDPEWKQHDAIFNNGGSQMFAYDVNGDGLNDVITSYEGHGYCVLWYEQTKEDGVVGWNRHAITGGNIGDKMVEGETGVVFSQPHSVDLVDMNGDGVKDIVSGKRIWAHGPDGDMEPNAPAVLYWFELKREGGKARYVAHLIDDHSGVGTQVMAVDINGDKKPDVVVGNKNGAFVFLQK